MNAITPASEFKADSMRSDAQRIVQRVERLASERSIEENTWRVIADVIRPMRWEIGRTDTTSGGRRRQQRMYDSTPRTALSSFAGGMYGMMTNPANAWFEIQVSGDPELNEFEPVKAWLQEVTDRLRISFSTSVSNFYQQVIPLYKDLGGFGSGVFYTAERPDGRIYDAARSLAECYADQNEWDEIDTTYRRFRYTARQAVERWGDRVSEVVRKANAKNPEQKFAFIHAVEPNRDRIDGRAGPDGMAWTSVYVEVAEQREVQRGGFEEFPFNWPRWEVAANEMYGRGIGEQTLEDTLTLHQQAKTNLTAGQRAADPPLNAVDELATKGGIRTYPSGINYGGMGADGRPRLAPLFTGMQLPVSLEMAERTREQVKDAWFFALMQMVQTPNQTATEYLGRQEEKLRLMSPHLGRVETEMLRPSIKRRFNILWRRGEIPPPPMEITDAGMDLDIEFVSPLARMQKTIEANASIRVAETAGQLEQLGITGSVDRVDADEVMETVAEGFGASRVLRSKEDAEAIRQQRQQQQQMLTMAEQAPSVAKAAKDGVDAVNAYNQGGEAAA